VHYYKFNIADWVLHTAHLSPEEEGVYLRLVNFYYDSEQPIPEKTQSVIRRLRLVNNSETVGIILEEFFELIDGFWRHKRCNEEINAYHLKADVNKANGSKGGRPKGSKGKKNQANKPKKTQSVISGNPNKTLTKNHKPLTNNKNNTYKKIQIPDGLENIDTEVREFIDHRANLKKPLTQNAFERFLATVFDISAQTEIPVNKIISETIDAGWQSCKLEWIQNRIGATNGQNRSGGNPRANQQKLTPAQRTAEKREQLRKSQSSDLGAVAAHGGDVRAPVGITARR
jgi:uncharacterized protein YdaU (DUF1376 family)